MAKVTEESYAASIPACCAIQGLQAHKDELMLCWGLCAAIEADRPMDCSGCDLNTQHPMETTGDKA